MTGTEDLGFDWEPRKDGIVVVRREGAMVAFIRGARAAQLLATLEQGDEQQVLARWTGNYRRGNERRIPESRRRSAVPPDARPRTSSP